MLRRVNELMLPIPLFFPKALEEALPDFLISLFLL